MTTSHPLPTDFDSWTTEEQLDYAQRVWKRIEATQDGEVEIHSWQLEEVQIALENYKEHPESAIAAEDVFSAIRAKLEQSEP